MKHLGALLLESWRGARASIGGSVVVAVVTAMTCLLVLATAGRSAAMEADIVKSMDQVGARLIVVTSTSIDAGADAGLVARAGQLAAVEWGFGVGPAVDARNVRVPGGGTAAVRAMYGSPPGDLRLTSGRWPASGEAVVSVDVAARLGLESVAGQLIATDRSQAWDVVGTFSAHDSLAEFERVALSGPEEPFTLGMLYAVVDAPQSVPAVAAALDALAGVQEPGDVTVTTPDQLVELSQVVTGQLGAARRQQALGVMTGSLVFTATALYASLGTRRRDFGRRRALGASRSALIVMVIGQALWPALIGAVLGVSGGLLLMARLMGSVPAGQFVWAVGVLAVIVAVVAAIPAALSAALRDPVKVLRVP